MGGISARLIGSGLLFLASSAPGQRPASIPDFSGHWVLVSPVDAAPEAARDLRITQTVDSVTVVRSPSGTFQTGTYKIGIVGGTVMATARTSQSIRIVDGALLVQSSFEPVPPASGVSNARGEAWSVAGDRLTIRLSERRDDRPTLDLTVVYRRVRE